MLEPYQPQDSLSLWWLGDPQRPEPVGQLSLALGGRAVALRYADHWLAAGFALSDDLPLRDGLFIPAEKDRAAGAVDDARTDRWGERVIRKFEMTPRLSILEFLLFAGDDRSGALGVSSRGDAYVPWTPGPVPEFHQLEPMAEAVRMVLANEPVPERQRRLVRPGGSLGGARPKSLLQMDGRQWIVKFPEVTEYDEPLVEHATMRLAAVCGIDVAPTRAIKLGHNHGRGHVVAVERFDRAEGARLHAVSANVLLKAAGEELGYPELAQLLRRMAPADRIAEQQQQLFRRMVFNILMDNTDDHEKNHALLRQADGRYLLSPAFDVVPAAQGLGYQQLAVGQHGAESTLANAMSSAAQFGLRTAAARAVVREVCGAVDGWKQAFAAAGVKDDDIDYLARFIDRDALRLQRAEYNRGG
ncbi:type II toxin-antitoxin system HipA family toxin [Ramlibacter sp. WS9]|uniref:type II toxin-antitoxin system HipA family toxin n=1 Tax=Ramlibacter sp. WS9 TaxID=1882741 RepID=UPI001141F45F|nr:HipA domain-containing protein [Ramlibacter sp. WS9]ROZ78721.1 type II toxin-antitoxin system HipA family toxin [Ramlibacter sp. WS9]